MPKKIAQIKRDRIRKTQGEKKWREKEIYKDEDDS